MKPPAKKRLSPKETDRIEAIYARLAAVMPEPKTELHWSNPYTLVTAVALSAQATDVSVNKATEKLFAVADTPAKMLDLGEAGLIPYIKSIGIEPAIAVDTHVFRIAHRLKLSDGKTPDQVEADLMRVTPAAYRPKAHHWLILHGRYTCVARRPKCEICPIGDLCPSRDLFA